MSDTIPSGSSCCPARKRIDLETLQEFPSPPNPYSLKVSSSHFSVRCDTWQSFWRTPRWDNYQSMCQNKWIHVRFLLQSVLSNTCERLGGKLKKKKKKIHPGRKKPCQSQPLLGFMETLHHWKANLGRMKRCQAPAAAA